MKRVLLALALFTAFAASATPGGEGNNTGCNGVGNANSPCAGTGNGGAGGNGGQGGAGGSAAAQARAEARATAIAAQQQAQQQGQKQISRNTVKTNVTNTVTGGPVNVSVSVPASTSTEKAGAQQETVKEAATAQKSDTVVVDNDNTRYPVATAYAAPLTASNGTCMGSSSAGAQGAALGVSFGTTWTDSSCDIRYDAEALRAAGLPIAARARLCQKPEIAKAMEAAGTPCPTSNAKRAESILNGEAVTQRQAMPWQAGG